MDICIPKSLTLTGTEKLSWMTDFAFKPLSLKCCRDLHRRKRHRQGNEYNLFSRIQNWVDDPIDESECSTSQSISNSGQVHLSPKDSGIDINSPPRKEDGNMSSLVMPDSRSEECERTSSQLKRRRLSLAKNLVSGVKLDLRNSQKVSKNESKNCFSASLRKPPETIPKRYTLISNVNENRPLVIKLRACPLEPKTSACNVNVSAGMLSPTHTELSDISSTMQPTAMSYDDTLHEVKQYPSQKSLHQVRNISTVVSSTTRCRQTKMMPRDRLSSEFSTVICSDFQAEKNQDSIVISDNKFPQILISMDNETTCQDAKFVDSHRTVLRQTLLSSNRRLQATSKQHAKQISGIVNLPLDVQRRKLSHNENGTGTVTSSCLAVGGEAAKSYCEIFTEDKLNFRNSSKYKNTTDEFTKSARSLDQSLRHLTTSFQVSRRHARIFRRSTLVPQLHQQVIIPKPFMLTDELERQCDEFVNDVCERIVCSTFDDHEIFMASKSDSRLQNTELNVDEMESEALLNEIFLDLPEVDFLSQENNEAIPNMMCKSFLNETERNDDIIFDEILFQLPVTSSLKDSLHCSRIIPGDFLRDLPSMNLSGEDLFISDQKQLIQLRRGVVCLLRTLVPQLHMPDRFDTGGHAVDELVDIVCGELSESEKEFGKTKIHSGALQNLCLNSSVELCRTPGGCLSRLRCKVLAMLRLLLGIDLDEFDNENHLYSLLDTIVSANCCDEELLSCKIQPVSSAGIQMCVSTSESVTERHMSLNTTYGEAVEEVSSVDSFSDIPELLVESERKFVLGEMDDFSEPPKLTAIDERYSCQ